MYGHRFLLSLLLLSAVACAQSAGDQPASSASQGSTAGTQAAPQNPSDDTTKKPSEADQKKSAASTFDVGEQSSGQDQRLGEVRLTTRYSEINGDTTRSFHVPGSNNLAEINYYEDRSFLGTQRLQVLSQFRGTDDRSIDPERNSLQKAYIRIYGQHDEVNVGDALVNYSRLSFNQNIKGVSTTFGVGDRWKVSSVGGVFIDRYGSLFKPYVDLPGRPFMAFIGGARAERKFFKDSTLGFNFSSSQDQLDSLPPADPGSAPQPASNRVGSIDGKFNWKQLRVDSELAYGFTDFDTRSNAGCATCDSRSPNPLLGYQSDWGGRLDTSYRWGRLNLRESFVRYQPNFVSINARQISDLQDLLLRAGYDLTNWLAVDANVRRSNNDLRDQLPFETRQLQPEVHFTFHDLAFYKRGVLDVGYRERFVDASNGSINRAVRIPFAEFTVPIKTTSFSLGYERRQARDQIDATQSSNTDRIYTSLRGIYDIGGWHLNPNIRYELERGKSRPVIIQPVFNPFFLEDDSNRLASASLYTEAPKYFIVEVGYRSSGATLLSNGIDQNTKLALFSPSGFLRPSYTAAVSYKINNDENYVFKFGFERNNNFYRASNNYNERLWSGTLIIRFGRRSQ